MSLRPLFDPGTGKLSAVTETSLLEGYLALATWTLDPELQKEGCSIKSFTSGWTVPPDPTTQSRHAIFLFPAFQTSASAATKAILQPVLQWGANLDGSPGWGIACYYVSGSRQDLRVRVRTKPVRVKAGDNIRAEIKLITKDRGVFGYTAEFSEPIDAGIYIETADEFVRAGVALEVYGVKHLSDLPNADKTRFARLEVLLDDGTRAAQHWDIVDRDPQDNIKAVAISHDGYEDEVDIFYR